MLQNAVLIVLGTLTVVLNIIVLVRVDGLFKELRSPLVKKLGPDLKLKPRQPSQSNPLAGNRPMGQSSNGPRPMGGNRPMGQSQQQGDRDRNRSDRGPARNERNRDDRGGRRDDRRDDRRRDRRDRNEAPMGNDAFGRQGVETTEMDPPATGSESRPEVRPASEQQSGRPSFEGRRPLQPQQAAETISTEAPAAVAVGAPEGAADEGEGRQIRYGRRPLGKKLPTFDEPAAAVSENRPQG